MRDLLGGPVIKHPPSNAEKSSVPGWEIKIPHAAGQLSQYASATELCTDFF